MSTIVGALIIIGGCFAAFFGFAAWDIKRRLANTGYTPLPEWPAVKACILAPGVTTVRVAAALANAVMCLAHYAGWDEAKVRAVAAKQQIKVEATPAWTDRWGRHVGGTSAFGTLQVGSDLAALCHELAHACETEWTGTTDESHATWQQNGIQRAIDSYESGVKS